MSNFKLYSEYYDLLYKDKDYEGEVDYIDKLIKKYQPEAKNIIDFGCGTGNHDKFLSEKGYSVLGVDLSENMIELAKDKNSNVNLDFKVGDIRTFESNKKYDVATALFHVMSYQISNEDLKSSISNVNRQLNIDGLFLFDFWYGPAVLNDKPSTRIKKLKNDNLNVTRLTESNLKVNDNYVEVNFEVIIERLGKEKTFENITETHKMRYLFLPELQIVLKESGFKIIDSFEWKTFYEPTINSWYVILVCKKTNCLPF
jgi:SAM-dependent methyltransferase